ncbi:hypothetical protein QBC47DRAFT_300979 [Echria macrotheca]|uniref:Uncharacterized protein n=1 Tax=Echria macrotheca TaxID=438768 RepID=A0AAJ0F657_9PEZI|nr:hypothetical protein QBC47DRAFT_300979 [Echria macrotheca]
MEKLQAVAAALPDNLPQGTPRPVDPGNKTGPDWTTASWYRGSQQPPLAMRLETAINFLADEDVDRHMAWTANFTEVVAYLNWLATGDPDSQLSKASPATQDMFALAVSMAQAHVQFERFHFEPTELEIRRPTKLPLAPTRLDWVAPVPGGRNQLPRAVCPRFTGQTVGLLPSSGSAFDAFAEDAAAAWATDDPVDGKNLAVIEDDAFQKFNERKYHGGIHRDPVSGDMLLPDGSKVTSDNEGWAVERGARRVALQQLLRLLGHADCTAPGSKNQVVLPLSAATLDRAVHEADGPLWRPPSLHWRDIRPELRMDPWAFVDQFPQIVAENIRFRELALRRAQSKYGAQRGWVTLPPNVTNGGPFVWRMLDLEEQDNQDLLGQCRLVVDLLKATALRSPRKFLDSLVAMASRKKDGRTDYSYPKGVVPDQDDIVQDDEGGVRHPRLMTKDELQWLRFLTSESVSPGTWEGRFYPDEPREKHKLFLIFARRMQKLLDDRSPEALLADGMAQASVEQVLEVINAGVDTSPVERVAFTPFQACAFLDRMRQTGHVRFRENPGCYGIVMQPEHTFHPEHRILFPADGSRPSYPRHVADWESVVRGDVTRTKEQAQFAGNYFAVLAVRLSYTIQHLGDKEERYAEHKNRKPARTEDLRQSLKHFRDWCEKAYDEPLRDTLARLCLLTLPEDGPDYFGMSVDELLTLIRGKIIEEISENKTMLHPTRRLVYVNKSGESDAADVRDVSWDWASPAVRPPARLFWSLSRWPLKPAGHITKEDARNVTEDVELDPAQTYDPTALDPIENKWYRPRLRRYGEEDATKYKHGDPSFPIGDTARQRKAVEQYITLMATRGMFVPVQEISK